MINKFFKFLISRFSAPAFFEPSDKLDGKVIVITGGTQGIGQATAKLLQVKGATVISLSRSSNIKTDVTNFESCQAAIKEILAQHERIDVLINNAGVFLDKPLESTTSLDFKKIVDVNIQGVFNMCKAVVTQMKGQKSGLIINIGSKISHNTQVTPNKVIYAMSKHALEGFSFALNRELKAFGIRVTCLMPGTVATFISQKSPTYLSPYDVANIIKIIIENTSIDFESLIFKSVHQDI